MSNISFYHSVFYPFGEFLPFSLNLKLSNANSFSLKIFRLERVDLFISRMNYYHGFRFISCVQLAMPHSPLFIDKLLMLAFNDSALPSILFGGCNMTKGKLYFRPLFLSRYTDFLRSKLASALSCNYIYPLSCRLKTFNFYKFVKWHFVGFCSQINNNSVKSECRASSDCVFVRAASYSLNMVANGRTTLNETAAHMLFIVTVLT